MTASRPGALASGDLFQLLRDGDGRTRSELADLTGLARSTIAARVDELIASGLVAPAGEARSSGGRPPTRFAFDPHSRVVLAADTLVALDGRLLGKPADRAEAARLLRLLSGRTHFVITSVFIGHLHLGRSIAFSVLSRVVFKKLSDRMIKEYLATIDPLDKAGGYAAQGTGRC